MKSLPFILMVAMVLLLTTCRDGSTGPDDHSAISFAGYSTACLDHSVAKLLGLDSLKYVFNDSLVIDYFTERDCSDGCPFAPGYAVKEDTLALVIADTLLGGANCVCDYRVHFALSNLPLDHYVVRGYLSRVAIDPTLPYSPFRHVTYYDTVSFGDVYRTR